MGKEHVGYDITRFTGRFAAPILQTPDELCVVCAKPFYGLNEMGYQPNWKAEGGRAHANCVQKGAYVGHMGTLMYGDRKGPAVD